MYQSVEVITYSQIWIWINQVLIFIEKLSPLLGFEPPTSRVTSRWLTNEPTHLLQNCTVLYCQILNYGITINVRSGVEGTFSLFQLTSHIKVKFRYAIQLHSAEFSLADNILALWIRRSDLDPRKLPGSEVVCEIAFSANSKASSTRSFSSKY